MGCPTRWYYTQWPIARVLLYVDEKGLWEEHLAKLTGKQVNQQAVIGGRVCRIDEAEEPSDVLWENIDTSIFQRCGR